MTATFAIAAFAGAGLAALLVLALRGHGPMAAWCAAFAGTLLVWTTADAAHTLTGAPVWHALDVTTSPFTIPIGLHVAASFAGRGRALRPVLVAAWVWFGAIALASAPSIAGGPPLLDETPWTAAYLVGIVVAATVAAREIARVRRQATGADERARASLLLVALPFAAVFGTTDLLATFAPGIPELAPLGVLGSAAATAVVALRWRLFGRDVSTASGVQALAVATTAVAAYVLAAVVLASSTAALILVVTALTAALVVTVRHLAGEAAIQRARGAELVRLGRAAAQMAHDLKNPLAAIRGAADVLAVELRRAVPAGDPELVELAAGIRDDADRLARRIDDYRRFVRVEVVATPVDVPAWLAACATTARRAAPRDVAIDALPCTASVATFDAELVEQVVDNLVQNAFDALEGRPGRVVLAAEDGQRAGRRGTVVRVEDDGPGMDARTRELATDDFFTTRAAGSGLGLAFARRVAEAHGGSLRLGARVGGGASVEVWLPAVE